MVYVCSVISEIYKFEAVQIGHRCLCIMQTVFLDPLKCLKRPDDEMLEVISALIVLLQI